MSYLLEIKNLNKNFGATKALQDVSLEMQHGEIHALLGENGAGKSTLIKILSGVYPQESGDMLLCGKTYSPKSIVDARSLGISAAFQELSLLPNLTVAENLFLPNIPKNALGLTSAKKVEQMTEQILSEYKIEGIRPSQKVELLSVAQKQRLETVRAMIHDPKLLILDEATAALIDPEWLFEQVDHFTNNGTSILFITHRLREARRLCDQFTILRNGCKVITEKFDGISDGEIFRLMAGRSIDVRFPACASTVDVNNDEVTLSVQNLRADKKIPKDDGITFVLRKGEVLGIAGLEGQGQRELFNMLGGSKPIVGGSVEIEGCSMKIRNPHDAMKSGLVLIPEERKTEAIFPGIKTSCNVSISVLDAVKNWCGIVNRNREIDYVDFASAKVQLDNNYYGMPIDALSGGNQQKAIVGRALLSNAKCLLLFDPTRGVDIGTKQNIYQVIRDFSNAGGSVLFYSTELPEIVGLADRCAVFYRKKVVTEISHDCLSEPAILEAMLGMSPDRISGEDNA
ncbi:MAG: sugar ABC transporter ATP-binding protein [Deltaproteobacteria bacterium]|nr:sugar ABC transporter ATP-binding protein [Deltaproteobacteria bacterium]